MSADWIFGVLLAVWLVAMGAGIYVLYLGWQGRKERKEREDEKSWWA